MNSGGSLSTHSIVRLEKMVIPYTLIARITLFQSPYIIAISGFGGAGKSTFASALGNAIGEIRELPLTECVIVEGVGLFRPTLLSCFSLLIWVDCPIEEAISRGMERDREEYNNPQDETWEGIWKRNDEEFYAAFDPRKAAHIIIDNSNSTHNPSRSI